MILNDVEGGVVDLTSSNERALFFEIHRCLIEVVAVRGSSKIKHSRTKRQGVESLKKSVVEH